MFKITTIKGPFSLNKNNVSEFINKHSSELNFNLPFEASGWKSTQSPIKVNEIKDISNKVETPKPIVVEVDKKKSSSVKK